ncbi:hypothetical protein GY45DRAFT_1375060 [Cubamyces sp. BRFM 1775]|nr:hypothetical protein GY45DRAFT_1375060 [Cubamyces sp. BRFM 1775]
MGQANSRSSTPPPPVSPAQRPHLASQSSSSTAAQSSQQDGVEPVHSSVSLSTKAPRRASVRRSVRNLLRPRTHSDATASPMPSSSSSPSSPTNHSPSFRKRWRSSRRFSKAPASLPNLSEALHEGDIHPPAPAATVDAQVLSSAPEEQPISSLPSSTGTPAQPPVSLPTVAAPPLVEDITVEAESAALSPDDDQYSSQDHHVSQLATMQPSPSVPGSTKVDASTQCDDRAQEIEREINDFLLERPRQDSLFVEGSSQDGQISDAPDPSPIVSPSPLPDIDGSAPGAADLAPQAPRHFPPPGTLVVVQGVVNTSDNPPAAQSSTNTRSSAQTTSANASAPSSQLGPRSSSVPRTGHQLDERHNTRRRLSSFIPRPSSMLRRRSSGSEPSTAPSSFRPSRSSSDISSTAFDASATSESSDDAPDPSASTASQIDQHSGEDADSRARPLSPGSIDVLGTLLSVAAAATAASLFSPSLGFQANTDANAPQPPAAIPRPMSPTPTAGLGGGPGFSDLAAADPVVPPVPAPAPAPQQREGRERIRNVWESFRERLGLNRSGLSQASGGSTASNSEDPANMRPSEIMLAEMARALNVGLGLTTEGSSTESTASASFEGATRVGSDDPNRASRPPPPEDSFERFLLNLQADLRVALSESGMGATAPSSEGGHTHSGEDRSTASDHATEADTPIPAQDDLRAPSPSDDNGEGEGIVQDDDELPPLQDLSDSEDEEDYDEADMEEDRTSVRTATPMPSGRDIPNRSNQASPSGRTQDERGDGERRPPGIQLWRLYRFQPIHANQIAGHAAATTPPNASAGAPSFPHTQSSHSPPSPPSSSSPSAHAHESHSDLDSFAPAAGPSSPPQASSPSSLSPSPSPSTSPVSIEPSSSLSSSPDGAESTSSSSALPATDPNANMVVPVIVVGLQSVEMGQVHGHAHPHDHHHHDLHEDSASSLGTRDSDSRTGGTLDEGRRSSSTISADNSNSNSNNAGDATPRGRSWQSRAATALRNLRPGRRNGSRTRQTTEGAGSRTFLIYVIGAMAVVMGFIGANGYGRSSLSGYYPPNHHMVTGPDNLDSYEALWELAELLGQVKPQVATWEDIEKSDLQTVKFSQLEQYEREGRVASNCVDRCLICLDDYQPEDDVRLMHCRHAFHKDCVDKWLQGVSTADELVH